jgi:hypothetical protein
MWELANSEQFFVSLLVSFSTVSLFPWSGYMKRTEHPFHLQRIIRSSS